MAEEITEEKPSLIGIITSPTEQFERIRKRPVFWGALGVIALLSMCGLLFTSIGVELPNLDELSEEEIAVGKTVGTISVMIFGVITLVIDTLFSTVLYLLIAKINRTKVTFRQLFSMNTYIMIITALSFFLNGLIIAVLGKYSESDTVLTSLGSFVDLTGPAGVLVDHIEIFSIWTLILTAIGLQKVARFSKGQAWIVVIAFFVVGLIFAMTNIEVSALVN